MSKTIYYSEAILLGDKFFLAATEAGLLAVSLPNEMLEDFVARLTKKYGKQVELVHEPERLKDYVQYMRKYEANSWTDKVELGFDLQGTPFQLKVWRELQQIPYGVTISYKEMAERIDNPKAIRAVGRAIGANPVHFFIPCHRVIGANGQLTGFSAGLHLKQKWLKHESDNRS